MPVVIIWLILTVFFIITELVSVGLTSIWFAVGALVALLASVFDAPIWLQVVLFFVVSIVALIATRPLAKKYLNKRFQKTNAESLVGETIIIKETVDNRKEAGMAVVHGLEWTVRSASDELVIPAGNEAVVKEIQGVKLIVKAKEEE